MNTTVPWNLIHSFHAVAEEGSLLAAARRLNLTQPTVGRHIDLLEDTLRTTLFVRGREGMTLTAKGKDLVVAAAEMVSDAQRFERIASGLGEDLSGPVRLAANELFGTMLLPYLLADLIEQEPGLEIEIAVSNAAANLSKRDADIAVRMFRPTQNDLIARKITDMPLGLYAHERYLERAGIPAKLNDLKHHVFIGFDQDPSLIDASRALGLDVTSSDFRFRCDSFLAQFEAIRAGIGIGVTHQKLGERWPGVRRVLTHVELPSLPLWLACHADVRYNPRVRRVMDFLGDALKSPYPPS